MKLIKILTIILIILILINVNIADKKECKKLIDKIDGSRSVVINDPLAYAEHTKQIEKLNEEIENIEKLQKKY